MHLPAETPAQSLRRGLRVIQVQRWKGASLHLTQHFLMQRGCGLVEWGAGERLLFDRPQAEELGFQLLDGGREICIGVLRRLKVTIHNLEREG